jgi:hypothetical protein
MAESFNAELPDVIYRQTNQKIEPVRENWPISRGKNGFKRDIR